MAKLSYLHVSKTVKWLLIDTVPIHLTSLVSPDSLVSDHLVVTH